MFTIIIGGIAVLFFGSVALPRGRRLWKGLVGSMFNSVEEANPELLFQAAQDDYRKRVAGYNNALGKLGGTIEMLKRQIVVKQDKLDTLTTRIQANIDAGNNDLAASLAGQHDSLETDLGRDKEQFAQMNSAFEANEQNIKQANDDYKKKVQSFQNRLAQAKIDEALAEAGSALQNVSFKADDVTSAFSRAEEIINKRSADAAGKARVIASLGANSEDVKVHEAEQKALDKAALAKFMAKKGQSVAPNSNGASVAPKEMGPVSA